MNNKKNILFCTNCQGHCIIKMLELNDKFNASYKCDIIENWILLKDVKFNIDKLNEYNKKLENADIFVYQPLKKEHGKLSTETENGLLKYLKKDAKIISIPYIYNNGFWPFFKAVNIEDEFYPGLSNRKFVNLECINQCVSDTLKCNEHLECNLNKKTSNIQINCILKKYVDNKIDFKYKDRFYASLKILENNENKYNTNIKVSKFIEDNYQKYRLFLSKDHPTTRVFLYCANEILKILKLDELNYEKLSNELNENYCQLPDSEYNQPCNKWLITKQCAKELNLNYNDDDDLKATSFFFDMLKNILQSK